MNPPADAGGPPGPGSPIDELIAQVRAGMNLRDGYYLREELADLYLIGVLRGIEVHLSQAIAEPGGDTPANRQRLTELAQASEELLRRLNLSRGGI